MTTEFDDKHSAEDRLAIFRNDMQGSGLKPETADENNIKVFDGSPDVLASMLNIPLDFAICLHLHHVVILFPYPDLNVSDPAFYRIKLIPPYSDKDGKLIKYLQPKGISTRPYIIDRVWNSRKDTSVDIFIVEGEKKSLLLNQEGFPAIALPGVYNFRNSSEVGAEFVDLEVSLQAFTWTGRNVYVAFDADFRTNPQVRLAMFELAFRLENHGAVVKIVTWNSEDGKGIDDYVIGKGDCRE